MWADLFSLYVLTVEINILLGSDKKYKSSFVAVLFAFSFCLNYPSYQKSDVHADDRKI